MGKLTDKEIVGVSVACYDVITEAIERLYGLDQSTSEIQNALVICLYDVIARLGKSYPVGGYDVTRHDYTQD